jgi:hypothetical protein
MALPIQFRIFHLPISSLKTSEIKIYKTIISPVALYVCETWSLKLRELNRLRGSENRVLRRISEPKREK